MMMVLASAALAGSLLATKHRHQDTGATVAGVVVFAAITLAAASVLLVTAIAVTITA
jgi:hypothetical protein